MTKYLFYLAQILYFTFLWFFAKRPLGNYIISGPTGIILIVCGAMALTEVIKLGSLKTILESTKKNMLYLVCSGCILIINILWQNGMAKPPISLGYYLTIFVLDFLSMFFLLVYVFYRGALLFHFISGGSEQSRLKPKMARITKSPWYIFFLAGFIALLANIGNLVFMLVSWKLSTV